MNRVELVAIHGILEFFELYGKKRERVYRIKMLLDAWMLGARRVFTNQQFFIELFAVSQSNIFYRDVAVWV